MMRMRVGLSKRGVLGSVALVALVGAMTFAPDAFAESGWWHLTSGTRPASLEPRQAKDEVQEVTVSATGGFFYLVETRSGVPNFEKFTRLPFDATAAEVQQALRSEVFPYRLLTVTEGSGEEEDTRKYIITFPGQSVEPMEKLTFELSGAAKSLTVNELGHGRPAGKLVVTAANLGDADLNGAAAPIELADAIPADLQAVAVEGKVPEAGGTLGGTRAQCALSSLACTFTGTVAPYDQIEMLVSVIARSGASSGEVNQASISGGEATPATVRRPVNIGGATSFGVQDYEMTPEEEGGETDTQAGSHPFQLTTTLTLNQDAAGKPAALAKDLDFKLPPGLIGNPTPFPQCTLAQFQAGGPLGGGENLCSSQTAVGAVQVTVEEPKGIGVATFSVPLFNVEPALGEPARFGFSVIGAQVLLDTSVRTGGDYGVTVTVRNISQVAGFTVSQVTFWGVPGDPRHDAARGWSCMKIARGAPSAGPCKSSEAQHPPPLLTLPTSCTGPLQTSVEADSWASAGSFASFPSEPMQALDGCNRLLFNPSISVTPDGQAGSTPTGLTVGVHVPQDVSLDPEGLSEADVKDTTVVLPAGVVLNPAAADGLQACSEAQIALSVNATPACPEASKIATLEIKSPLLPNPLTGEAYLATQDQNPFGSLVALYLVAQDPVSGTLVKLAGEVRPDPVTGQLVSTFQNTPQLPFEDLKLHFFGGDRAPLATPGFCGAYTTGASIAPWSGDPSIESSSSFDVLSGPNGSPCHSPLLFNPSLTAGTTSIQAGGFSPFTMTMSREDGQQSLQAISLKMPPGLSGLLSGVKLCGEPQADEGLCGHESEIGETIVSVGVGGDPYSVRGGKVFITEGYDGAPYGLSIVNPAKAGPYDLERDTPCDCVVVRAKIEVDPITAALTITSDNAGTYKIPTILDGIPLQIQHVNVTINRPGFTFNPTNCEPMKITGSLSSTEGATSNLSVPLQVTNCAVLGFKPAFSVSTAGETSRTDGASLHVKLVYPKARFGSQTNIKSVKVDLPKQLPSRLTTLQKACPASTFDQNPASCGPESRIGTAKATTPLLPVPLAGPVYFVSYAGLKFPELVIVLSGYGTTIQLHAETFISKAGTTSSTFRTIPDAPVGTFELTLPQGKFSALAAPSNLCKSALKMPTAFTAQNGATIKQSTPIAVTGCAKAKKKTHREKKVAKHHKGTVHGKK